MIFEKLQVLILGPEDVVRRPDGSIVPRGSMRTMMRADLAVYIDASKAEAMVLKCRQAPLRDGQLDSMPTTMPAMCDLAESMFGPKPGSWSVYSQSDPRWNRHGRCNMWVTAGPAPDALAWIEECKASYGEPPDDLDYSCMKD